MENVNVEDMVAEEFEATDPNLEIFEEENEHFSKVIEGVESIIKQFRSGNQVQIGGCEAYAVGALKADNLQWDIHKGYEGFISDAAKKLYEMVTQMLKRIREYFFGEGSGDDKMSMAEDATAVDEKEKAIESAKPRNAKDAIAHGPVLKDENALVAALTTEAPKNLPAIRNAADERANTIAYVRHDLSSIGTEIRGLLSSAGVTSSSEQQKVIRMAIANKVSDSHVEATFDNTYDEQAFSIGIQKNDSVAINSLKTVKTRLDSYINFFNQHKEDLPGRGFGEWSGWWVIQDNINKNITGHAMQYLLNLCKEGNDMERAIERDTNMLKKDNEQVSSSSANADLIAQVAIMQQVLSRECNVAGEIKSSQKKIKKALNRQIAAIEKARANLVVNCVKAHLKDK